MCILIFNDYENGRMQTKIRRMKMSKLIEFALDYVKLCDFKHNLWLFFLNAWNGRKSNRFGMKIVFVCLKNWLVFCMKFRNPMIICDNFLHERLTDAIRMQRQCAEAFKPGVSFLVSNRMTLFVAYCRAV